MAGITQLADSVTDPSVNKAATAKAVQTAYDHASAGISAAATAQSTANNAQNVANNALTIAGQAIPLSQKAAANGVAPLNASGQVPQERVPLDLPGNRRIAVDSVLETGKYIDFHGDSNLTKDYDPRFTSENGHVYQSCHGGNTDWDGAILTEGQYGQPWGVARLNENGHVYSTQYLSLVGHSPNWLYVDVGNGNDTTGTGTPQQPFRTLAKAFENIYTLPFVGTVNIELNYANSGTNIGTSGFTLNNVYTQIINIHCNNMSPNFNTPVIVGYNTQLRIYGDGNNRIQFSQGLKCGDTSHVKIENFDTISAYAVSGRIPIEIEYFANLFLSSNIIIIQGIATTSYGISCIYLSKIFLLCPNINVYNAQIGLRAYGGTIQYSGTITNQATSQEYIGAGGRINDRF